MGSEGMGSPGDNQRAESRVEMCRTRKAEPSRSRTEEEEQAADQEAGSNDCGTVAYVFHKVEFRLGTSTDSKIPRQESWFPPTVPNS